MSVAKQAFMDLYGESEKMRQRHWGEFKVAWNAAISIASLEATRAELNGKREDIARFIIPEGE